MEDAQKASSVNQMAYENGREKTWEELKVEEKIDRMHGVIKQLQSHLQAAQEEIEIMKSHEHDKDNKIVFRIPIAESYKLRKGLYGGLNVASIRGNEWF